MLCGKDSRLVKKGGRPSVTAMYKVFLKCYVKISSKETMQNFPTLDLVIKGEAGPWVKRLHRSGNWKQYIRDSGHVVIKEEVWDPFRDDNWLTNSAIRSIHWIITIIWSWDKIYNTLGSQIGHSHRSKMPSGCRVMGALK